MEQTMFNFWKACFPLFKKKTDEREQQYTLLPQNPIDNDNDADTKTTTTTVKDQKNVRFAGEYPRPPSPEVKERYMGFGIGGAGNMRKSVSFFSFPHILPFFFISCGVRIDVYVYV